MRRSMIGLITLFYFVSLLSSQIIQPGSTSPALGISTGDIVDVHYILTLYGYRGSGTEKEIQEGDLESVELQPVQSEYLQKFVDGLYGLFEGNTKKFMIPKQYGYTTNPEYYGELYNQDLYYEVTITDLIYDALPNVNYNPTSVSTTVPSSETSTAPSPRGVDPILVMGLLGLGVLVISGGSILYVRSRSSSYEEIQATTDSVISKEKAQLMELSKIIEEKRKETGKTADPETKKTRAARRRR
ncbi:MAG: FKBP-type peptidyl-prolyl cis-trans isomerase [Candidatus Odinarchaeota archaeon]